MHVQPNLQERVSERSPHTVDVLLEQVDRGIDDGGLPIDEEVVADHTPAHRPGRHLVFWSADSDESPHGLDDEIQDLRVAHFSVDELHHNIPPPVAREREIDTDSRDPDGAVVPIDDLRDILLRPRLAQSDGVNVPELHPCARRLLRLDDKRYAADVLTRTGLKGGHACMAGGFDDIFRAWQVRGSISGDDIEVDLQHGTCCQWVQ